MAEQAAPAPQQAPVEQPAASAPDSMESVTTWAKAEATRIATESTETPAAAAPASTTPEPTAAESEAEPAPETAEKLSRRQRDEQRRTEIRAEVKAEFDAEQQRSNAETQQREAEQSLLTTIAKAKAGDYNAALELANITEGQFVTLPKQTQREAQVWQAGRAAVLADMAKDFEPAVRSVDGLSDDDFKSLSTAPTSGQFAKAAIDIGRRLERSALESKVATLEATITELRGKNAASGPSPLSANGSNGHGTLPAGASMRDIARQAAAEMGITY